MNQTTASASADDVARHFLAALDARRWDEAAVLVHPAALARFRRQQSMLQRLLLPGSAEPGPDTAFATPFSLVRLTGEETLETLSDVELVSRYAEGLDRWLASAFGPAAPLRLQRTVLGTRPERNGRMVADYEIDGGLPGSDEERLTLERSGSEWRIADATLVGAGVGRLVLPDDQFEALCETLGSG